MDVHFNSYKSKYDILDAYMRPVRNTQMVRTINIFINLDDLLHRLHRPNVAREFQITGKNAAKQLTSNVFNLVGHYKNWAVKRGMRPTVFVIYTTASRSFKNRIYIPNYRQHFLDINSQTNGDFFFINQAIDGSKGIIPVIAKYIRGVYAVDTKYLEPSAAPIYLAQKFHADWNLLISRDEYDIQYCYMDRWSVISPKGDASAFVTKKTMWDHIISRERIEMGHPFYFDPKLYVTMKAIAGDKYRSIPKLKRCGWRTIFGYVDEVARIDDPTLTELQEAALTNLITSKHLSIDDINKNIYCVDVEKQCAAFMETDRAIIDVCIADMEDFVSLKNINADVFREFPMNLQFLCRDFIQ